MTQDLYHLRSASPGRTRHCLWPWNYLEVRTDGGVALCCVRQPIGNLRDNSLDALRDGAAARSLRASLLSGDLDELCSRCLLAPLVPVSDFAQSVRQLLEPQAPAREPELTPEPQPEPPAPIVPRNRLAEMVGRLPGLRYMRLAKRFVVGTLRHSA